MTTYRPEITCGPLLASSSEVLIMGKYSFRSILKIEPLLGIGTVQDARNTKMITLCHPVLEKSQF